MNKTPPTILLRERQPQLATLSSGAGKTVEPFYCEVIIRGMMPNVKLLSPRQRTPSSPPPTLGFGGASQRTRSSGNIDDWGLFELERTLTKELSEGDLEVTPENLKKVFAHTADSFLGLVRQMLDMVIYIAKFYEAPRITGTIAGEDKHLGTGMQN